MVHIARQSGRIVAFAARWVKCREYRRENLKNVEKHRENELYTYAEKYHSPLPHALQLASWIYLNGITDCHVDPFVGVVGDLPFE
jgi:hypothetical protein